MYMLRTIHHNIPFFYYIIVYCSNQMLLIFHLLIFHIQQLLITAHHTFLRHPLYLTHTKQRSTPISGPLVYKLMFQKRMLNRVV